MGITLPNQIGSMINMQVTQEEYALLQQLRYCNQIMHNRQG